MSPSDDRHVEAAARWLGWTHAAVAPLLGGTRNRCYRLTQGKRSAVVRIGGEHDAAYAVARAAEGQAQRLAATHGLAPRLLYEDLDQSVMVMDFADGPVWDRETAESALGAARLGRWLARLHAVPLTEPLREVRFISSLQDYCQQLDSREARFLLGTASKRLLPRPAVLVFCHNDLHHLNLVETAGGLLALDWEYAGAGDPLMDLAGFIAYHDLGAAARQALLAGYGDHAFTEAPVEAARWLFEAVWWAWLELKRRLDGWESDDACQARERLVSRLRLA